MTRLLLPVLLTALSLPAAAQGGVDQQIQRNEARRDSIRQEIARLEAELSDLRGRERNISSEVVNLERQRLASTRLLSELDRQHVGLSAQLDTITLDLLIAEDALAEKRAIQEARIVEIYKRGPLWSVQVLLSAESFSDLLSRYKYLYLVSRRDQALVTEVEELRDRIARERRNLALVEQEVTSNRRAREQEITRLDRLEQERQRVLRQTRNSAERARARIAALEAAESEVNRLLTELERSRREALATGRSTLVPTITDASRGNLPWPVDGSVLYRFGPAAGPDGTTIPYLGVGIRAPLGSPVRAVADGRVRIAAPYGTYGPTVMVEHGGGFYTLYLYLSRIDVLLDQYVTQGQAIGATGGEASEEGPHLEFQLFQTVGQGQPRAVDPLSWLRRR